MAVVVGGGYVSVCIYESLCARVKPQRTCSGSVERTLGSIFMFFFHGDPSATNTLCLLSGFKYLVTRERGG